MVSAVNHSGGCYQNHDYCLERAENCSARRRGGNVSEEALDASSRIEPQRRGTVRHIDLYLGRTDLVHLESSVSDSAAHGHLLLFE